MTDICVVLTYCKGAPLEYPAFTLFAKCFSLELLQFCLDHLLDSKKAKSSVEFTQVQKLTILDLVQAVLVSLYSSLVEIRTDECSQDAYQDLMAFYEQYHSQHQDMVAAQSFWMLVTASYYSKIGADSECRELLQEHQQLARECKSNRGRSSVGAKVDVEASRRKMSAICLGQEFRDVFYSLKNMLLCVSYSKHATLRNKVMKIIKKLIKSNPIEMLGDAEVQQILKIRITDASAVTRESALDILHKNLSGIIELETDGRLMKEYMSMIIARAHSDTSLTVRKKLIQILS